MNRQTQPLGSVLVSKMLLPYDQREVKTVNGLISVDYGEVVAHLAMPGLTSMMQEEANREGWSGKIFFGTVLTGGAKIRCTACRNEQVDQLSNYGEVVVGGEMEGAGLLATCDPRQPIWVVVKGISDYADENRHGDVETGRATACQQAALFVLQAIAHKNL